MKNVAFVFPGQGTHYAGMGLEIAKRYKEANDVYEIANEIMGMDIRKLCFEGPEEELVKTENSQPTIHTTSIAILKVLEKYGLSGDVTAGFSLGEYSSLVYAGALNFEETVKLVRKRGLYMESAVPDNKGKMCAIVGLGREEVYKIVDDSKHLGHIEPSNFNCPGQIIVAGYNAAVDHAEKLARERGAKSTGFLKVSGPFHTVLLEGAGINLRSELDQIEVKNPQKRYVDNVTGKFFTDEDDLKELLKQHVYKPVMWEDSVISMLNDGVDTFIEIGPSSVLTPFNIRTAQKFNKEVCCYNVEDVASLENLLRAFDKKI
ncbi:ACP S-malonyltransferase [Wukongibacter baidiensis]|uniref:ACP S-malonyltransferase n=1 Tax=Wukongibacter baidiensis TaxID=1723361 RepID=UPI003D7F8D56